MRTCWKKNQSKWCRRSRARRREREEGKVRAWKQSRARIPAIVDASFVAKELGVALSAKKRAFRHTPPRRQVAIKGGKRARKGEESRTEGRVDVDVPPSLPRLLPRSPYHLRSPKDYSQIALIREQTIIYPSRPFSTTEGPPSSPSPLCSIQKRRGEVELTAVFGTPQFPWNLNIGRAASLSALAIGASA